MSLSFKTVNLFSSTYCTITQEQIQQILSPVSIVLVEEQVVEPQSTGPQMESTGSTSEPLGDVLILDNIPYITEDDVATRGPWGEITVGELTKSIVDDFENRTFGSDGTTAGPGGSSSGITSPRGRLINDRINSDDTASDGVNSDGSPSGTT